MSISRENSQKLLQFYLGPFYRDLDKKRLSDVTALVPKDVKFIYAVGGQEFLDCLAFVILLKNGKLKYRHISTHDILDSYFLFYNEKALEQMERPIEFYSAYCEAPHLILTHSRNTMESKRLTDLVNHTVFDRIQQQRPTFLLSDVGCFEAVKSMLLKQKNGLYLDRSGLSSANMNDPD